MAITLEAPSGRAGSENCELPLRPGKRLMLPKAASNQKQADMY